MKISAKQWHIYYVYFSVSLITAGMGMHFSWLMIAMEHFLTDNRDYVTLTIQETTWLAVVPVVGQVLGGALTGLVMDKIGRKRMTLIVVGGQVIAWILSIFATSPVEVFISRIFVGASSGTLLSCCPAYLAECSDTKIRGFISSSIVIGYYYGMIINNSYQIYLSLRAIALISLNIPLLYLAFYTWLPESPYYLLMHNKREEAAKSLRFLRMDRYDEAELDQIESHVQKQFSARGTYRQLFESKTNRTRFLLIICMHTIEMMSGLGPLSVYIYYIFVNFESNIPVNLTVVMMLVVQLWAVFLGAKLSDIFGRKLVMAAGTFFAALALLLFIVYLHMFLKYDISGWSWAPTLLLTVFFASICVGMAHLTPTLSGELFSVNIKAKALGFMTIYRSLVLGLSSKLFHYLWKEYGLRAPFYLFTVVCLLGFVFASFLLPETKGRTLAEIQGVLYHEGSAPLFGPSSTLFHRSTASLPGKEETATDAEENAES